MGGDGFQMPRFFVKTSDIHSDTIDITGEDVNHIKKVLRLNINDNIIVCDGNENDYLVRIESFEKDLVKTAVIDSFKNKNEPPVDITLFQGVPKSDKMDFIIQKSIELGVKSIVPVMTERTIVRLDGRKDAENKVSRWQRIALEAAKQCNRGLIPRIELPVSFNEALSLAKELELSIIPYEKETVGGLKNFLTNSRGVKKIGVIIGPEGGFSENEIEKAAQNGIKSVTLGPRILRTETAGLTVLSILAYELGDVGI